MSRKKAADGQTAEEFSDVATSTIDAPKKPKGPREVRYFAVAVGNGDGTRPAILKEERTFRAINKWLEYCSSLIVGVGPIKILKGKWVSMP